MRRTFAPVHSKIRLIVVGDGKDFPEAPAGHAAEQRVLSSVGALELVDQPISVDRLIVPDQRRVGEQPVRLQNERVEVQRVGAAKFGLVPAISPRNVAGVFRYRAILGCQMWFRLLRLHQPLLEVIDPRQQHPGCVARMPRTAPAQCVSEYRLPIRGMRIDREVRLDAQVHAVLTQHLGAKAMKGIDRGASFEPRHQVGDAARHHVRRRVGKRQGEDAKALIAGRIEQAGGAARKHARLAGARAGEHEQRAAVPFHGLALDVGQLGERRSQGRAHHPRLRRSSIASRNAGSARSAKSGVIHYSSCSRAACSTAAAGRS